MSGEDQCRRPRLLVAGYYGCDNAGDEAILGGLLAGLRQAAPHVEVVVASGDPPATAAAHGVQVIDREDVPAILEELRRGDLLVLGGGGLFEDYWEIPAERMLSRAGGGLPYYVGLPALAALVGTRSMICAVGVGPLHTEQGRELAASAFALTAGATVCDEASRELLAAIDPAVAARVEVTADAALLLPDAPEEVALELRARLGLATGERPLGLALRPWSRTPAGEGWLDEVTEALAHHLERTGARLLLLPFDAGDAALADGLARRLAAGDRVIRAPAGLEPFALLALVKECRAIVAMRYHAALFALRAGILPVALTYDPKVAALLNSVGAPDLVLGPERWQAAAIERLLATVEHDGRANHLPARLLPLARAAARNIDLLLGLLRLPREQRSRQRELLDRLAIDRLLAAWRSEEDAVRLAREVGAALGALESTRTELAAERDRFRQQRAALLADLADANRRLSELEQTVGYRVLSRGWAVARRWLPEGSRRRWIYGAGRAAVARLFGAGASVRRPPPAADVGAPDWRSELLGFADTMRQRRPAQLVVLFSGTTLDENEGQRPTQLALAMARRGVPVVFVHWRWSERQWRPQDRLGDGILQLPIDLLGERPEVIFGALAGIAAERLAIFEFPWPGFFATLAAAHGAGWIALYDVLDDWEEFHRLGQAVWFEVAFERHLIGSCDVVFAINEALAGRVRSMGGAGVEVVPNGVRPGIERVRAPRPLARGVITVGYFGYLAAAWFDWELVAATARARPDWRLYLIGYGGPPEGVALPPNVILLGRQGQSELAAFAASWDVGIVPFKAEKLTRGADPIKTYEYLAMGLPVVTTGVAAPAGAEQVVRQAQGVEAFLAEIEAAAARTRDPREVEARRTVAAACTWDHRLETMLASVAAGRQRAAEKRALVAS